MKNSSMNLDRRFLLSSIAATGGLSIIGAGRLLAQTEKQHVGPPVGKPWPPMLDAEVISADGTPIFFRHGGAGSVNVVFVHGWSCNHRFFGPQFSPVSAAFRVFALDLAGHGFSGPRKRHTVRDFASDVLAVADQCDGPILLVAHSAGGRVACELANKMDGRLLGIIGIDAFQNLGLPAPSEDQISAALDALRTDFKGTVERSIPRLFPAEVDPALLAWVRAQMTATNPSQAIAATEAFARAQSAAAIAGFSRPVIALNSDGVPTHREKIRSVLSNFDVHILAGQGHFPHLQDAENFNPLLMATLRRLVGEQTSAATVQATNALTRS